MGIIWTCGNHAGKPHLIVGPNNVRRGYCPRCAAADKKRKLFWKSVWNWFENLRGLRWGR